MVPLISERAERLHGSMAVPGDKSISHRALLLASQAPGVTRIQGLLEGEDVLNTARALQCLGVNVTKTGPLAWVVHGAGPGALTESASVLDMGNSGTGARLLMGLVASCPFTTFFTGDASLCARPMKRVSDPLEQMGARVLAREGQRMPLAVLGSGTLRPISYRLPVASAQVKSAVLLAALNTPGRTTVIEPAATRDHTENMLAHLGFTLIRETLPDGSLSVSLEGCQEPPRAERDVAVPADPSSAAFPLVAALIVPGSELTLTNVCVNPLRTGLIATLREMGGHIEYRNERMVAGERVADIAVRHGALKGVTVPAERAPSMIDEYPILAVAAACAKGETVMEGLAELRVKESDRLAAIVENLKRCGVAARAEGDTLRVTGNGAPPPGGATVTTHYDHRIAMAFLVLGMASARPVTVDDADAIATSFPGFAALMNGIGGRIARPSSAFRPEKGMVIAIDGPAASGKGTLARRLAEHFGIACLDTGSLYRAVGMKLVYADKDPHDVEAAVKAAHSIDEEDLANPRLRQERIGLAASVISAMPEVREALLEFQRRYAKNFPGAVLDGRDIGTVVCPDADFKFYLTAGLEDRARRRHRELQGQGIKVIYASVLKDLKERDARDERRSVAPLRPAPDAVVIDTSKLDANQVFEAVRAHIASAQGEQPSAERRCKGRRAVDQGQNNLL